MSSALRQSCVALLATVVAPPLQAQKDTGIGCRTPLRLLRMLLLGAVVPLALVGAALNARLVVYTPQTLATAPSDQRLLHDGISSFWCQGQSVTMNGSFNAFLMENDPQMSPHRPQHSLQQSLRLRDDVKEYWGFHLHRGSTINLRACARFEGGQLMIMRGLSNMRRCAWIGRRDSAESGEESDEHTNTQASKTLPGEAETDNFLHTMRTIWNRLGFAISPSTANSTHQSSDRMTEIDNLLNKVITLSKDRMEIMHSLYRQANLIFTGATKGNMLPKTVEIFENNSSNSKIKKIQEISQRSLKKSFDVYQQTKTTENTSDATTATQINMKHKTKHAGREERSVNAREDLQRAFEQLDKTVDNKADTDVNQLTELMYAEQAFTGDSSEGDGDFSGSSSEEALAKCEGILLNEVMQPSRQCSGSLGPESMQLTYNIPVTDTYYFVFSSDNEILPNLIYFNLTLDRAVFDTTDAKHKCFGVESCSLPIEFLSDNLVVVNVLPPEDLNGEESFVLNSKCQPRVPIYLTLILVVPIFIISCASR